MKKRLSLLVFLLNFLLISSVSVTTVFADEEEGISLAKQNKRMNLLKKADKASRRGKYDLALTHLQKAFSLTPIPDINDHYNIILIAAALKRCPTVILHAQAYELLAPEDPSFEEVKKHRAACMLEESPKGQISAFDLPPKSRVLLNGVLVAEGELSHKTFLAGTYTLEVRAPEYERHSEKIVLKNNDHIKRSVTLKKRVYYGTLQIQTQPTGATITIEGRPHGVAPLEPLRLTTGKHFVELKLKGYDRFIRNVKIKRDQTYVFEAVLEKASNNQ